MNCTDCKLLKNVDVEAVVTVEDAGYCEEHARSWMARLEKHIDKAEDRYYEIQQELDEMRKVRGALEKGLQDLV